MHLAKVICNGCASVICRLVGRVNENKKLGHNFYCSRKCESVSKTTAKEFQCSNTDCTETFLKPRSWVLANNFCSRSCAAKINNRRFPKRKAAMRACSNTLCQKKYTGNNKFCSPVCTKTAPHIYSKHDLTQLILEKTRELERPPTIREVGHGISQACARLFGSWNNAVIAAHLVPHRSHSEKMYRRIKTKARDGHECDSISEAIIDNWLSANNITHSKNTRYPTSKHTADWSLEEGRVLVEYFGLADDSPRYDQTIMTKKLLCAQNSIKLIDIYPKDLFPKNRLGEKFSITS